MNDHEPTTRVRREPPAFRAVTVSRVERETPRLARVTCTGPALAGFTISEPAASVRLLLPSPGTLELTMPVWNGNEFKLPNGQRPVIRTLTPRRFDDEELTLDLEIVLHGTGVASEWAEAAEPGQPVAISGPGRGYRVDAEAREFFVAGDETALPAISQLLEALPREAAVQVHIEAASPEAQLALPDHPRATIAWHTLAPDGTPGDELFGAVRDAGLTSDVRIWVAGEAAGVQRVRRHLFEAKGIPRGTTSIRGYWKVGRSGAAEVA